MGPRLDFSAVQAQLLVSTGVVFTHVLEAYQPAVHKNLGQTAWEFCKLLLLFIQL